MGLADPQKKSGGQLGTSETTTDPSQTTKGQQRQAERGERTAENIRYGQGISEQGMGGTTSDSTGEGSDEGYGQVEDTQQDGQSAEGSREAQGYGGGQDMDREVGA